MILEYMWWKKQNKQTCQKFGCIKHDLSMSFKFCKKIPSHTSLRCSVSATFNKSLFYLFTEYLKLLSVLLRTLATDRSWSAGFSKAGAWVRVLTLNCCDETCFFLLAVQDNTHTYTHRRTYCIFVSGFPVFSTDFG